MQGRPSYLPRRPGLLWLLAALGASSTLLGCSSAPATSGSVPAPETSVVGTYAATSEPAPTSVAFLQLEASNAYVMLRGTADTADVAESGTYTVNADLTQVTFTPGGPDAGAPSTHDLAVSSTPAAGASGQSTTMDLRGLALVAPISGSLVQKQAQSLTVDGASVQLVEAVQMRCPDGSRLVFPDLASAVAGTMGSGCKPRTSWGGL